MSERRDLILLRATLELREREIATLREALADLCGLRETISDDITAFDIGKDEAGRWRVWHEDYPDEGSIDLCASRAALALRRLEEAPTSPDNANREE